ncbi:MAG: LamG-like jellyroll fold domain-containing protein [Candidatus Cloacimonadota bacterium]
MRLKTITLFIILILALSILQAQNASVYFDGDGDYGALNNFLNAGLGGSTGLTFETWIKPLSLSGGSPVDSYRNTLVDFTIQGSNSVLSMYLRENGKILLGGRSRNMDAFQELVTPSQVITANVWQHVAGVLDYTNKKIFIYVNGNLAAAKELGVIFGSDTYFPATGGVKFIAASHELSPNHYFHGYMDEMRLWNCVRTQAEIAQQMQNPVSTQPYLLGYWKFNNNMFDSSGYGFDGSLVGSGTYGEPYLAGLYLYVVPVYTQAHEQSYVDLEVRVEGYSDPLRAYEVALGFDPHYLELESPDDIRKGDLLSSCGSTELLSTGSGGNYTITEAIMGVSTGAEGSGSLFTIRLKALQPTGIEGTPFDLYTAILRGPLNEDVAVADLLGSTLVIEELPVQAQVIPLYTGWNLISSWIVPQDDSMEAVFADLISAGYLVKVQNEDGAPFVYDSQIGWINLIGSFEKTEGYLVQVTEDCTLVITGFVVSLPLDIPLSAGWNFISYPGDSSKPAMQFLHQLIDNNKLNKVQDGDGNIILHDNGAWIDTIRNFLSGDAYRVSVTENTLFEYNESIFNRGTIDQPSHYLPIVKSTKQTLSR